MSRRKRDQRHRATTRSDQSSADASVGWSPRAARRPIERGEKLAIGVLFVAAIALRFSYQARISIEHWDEAVNASNIFLDTGYPNRFLYSPPLMPLLIELSMMALGKTPLAAVMPSLVLGSLTIPLCWWVGREWFGPTAGIAAAALAAFSDFQIVYSRTALTDAALGFWFLLAVYFCWRALARNNLGEAVLAGLAVACAWSTKYNGWLPLAVAISGFITWGLFERFNLREWQRRLPALAVIVVGTLVGWSPVWLLLQPDGGYSAVSANHAQYFFGLHGWWDDFKRQIANQRFYESWLTASGVILAWLMPAVIQRLGVSSPADEPSSQSAAGPAAASETTDSRAVESMGVVAEMSRRIHMLSAAATLAGVSLLIAWFGFCAVFAALFLGFVGLAVLVQPRLGDPDADRRRARNLSTWLLAAWFLGLLVAVPLYKPYPRLVMPWLVCAWMTSGACVEQALAWASGRWAARQVSPATQTRFSWTMWAFLAGGIGVLAIGVASRLSLAGSREIPGWQDRTLRSHIVRQAAQFARKLAPGKPVFLVYGEPALFFDLAIEGLDPQPPLGGDFSFLRPGQKPLPQPAYLLAYSQTADFDKLIEPYKKALQVEVIFTDTPSDLVLLDTYPPTDLAPGQPRPREALTLYRIKPH